MTSRIETFPVDGNSLQASSAKVQLMTVNTLMKNTLLRAMNRITELCPVMNDSHGAFGSFMDYVATFAEMTCLHLQGDERFFLLPNAQGKKLVDFLGTTCNPNVGYLRSKLEVVGEKAIEWGKVRSGVEFPPTDEPKAQKSKAPTCYKSQDMLSLLSFGDELVEVMRKQLDCIQNGEMEKEIDDKMLRAMIQENIQWLSGNSDISILLPFILSHHDSSSCSSWPTISPEGHEELPRLIDVHADLWKFAPFHPITKDAQSLAL